VNFVGLMFEFWISGMDIWEIWLSGLNS
jgi:hypothetical protein